MAFQLVATGGIYRVRVVGEAHQPGNNRCIRESAQANTKQSRIGSECGRKDCCVL